MTKSTIFPIQIKNQLAGTPMQDPKWATEVEVDGQKVQMGDPSATRAMVALMDMQAVLGGAASHFGGPSAFADLMAAAHGLAFHYSKKESKPWHELFHMVNDAGHCENGLYALKANYGYADLTLESLKGFRSIHSPLTGHGEAHLFPQGVYISNGPLGSGLPQAQGLAFADSLAKRTRVTMASISDGGCMEGEAREALAAIPGLALKGNLAPFVMIISDNNTKLSGRIDEESYSMKPTFTSLADKGWKVIELKLAHDIQACVDTINQAIKTVRDNPTQPVAILARTIKGYGVKATSESSSGGHGFPLKDPKDLRAFLQEIYGDRELPQEFVEWCKELEEEGERRAQKPASPTPSIPSEKVQVGVANAMIRKRNEGLPVISVSSDLPGSTGTAGFQKQFPGSSVDVGVAEANMVSMAIGLSKEGYIPVVDTFAQFGVTKGALPLMMASLSEAPVIAIFSHAGFQDAADGASHQALSYFAKTCAIPHTDVYSLTSSEEADHLLGLAIDEFQAKRKAGQVPHNKIFFLGRENFPRRLMDENYNYQLGKAQVVFDNSKDFDQSVTIAAAGPMMNQALKAAESLKQDKVGCIVVNPSIINHPDVETFKTCLAQTKGRLLTVEDHQLTGGMGGLLIHALVISGIPVQAKSLGVKDEFGQSAYKALELYKKHGLDADSIIEQAKALI